MAEWCWLYLRQANKRKRLKWAKEHRKWMEDNLRKALRTQESKSEEFSAEPMKRCWRSAWCHLSGGNVMVWPRTLFTSSAGTLSVMDEPAQSPDVNPVELLWERLDRMVWIKCPSSQSNVWEVLQEAWGDISEDYLDESTVRMPKISKALIAAIGGFFDESKV